MARVEWRGVTLDQRTAKMMDEVAALCGGITIDPSQGSYSNAAASAGTHSGGGAVDVRTRGLSLTQINNVVRNMRRVGFAAWYRTVADGFAAPHIHGVAVACDDLDDLAARQVQALRAGRNGLANNGADPHAWMNLPVTTWEAYVSSRRPPFPLPSGHSFGTPRTASVHDGTEGPVTADNVRKIQRRLSIKQTGRYGLATKAKVAAWQAWRRLPVSGRVGASTWKAMGL